MKKNDIVTVTIEDMARTGEGIGHADGMALFVKDALIGDTVRARITKPKKNYAFARCEEILEPSKDRCPARCPVARSCGGCKIQELKYDAQLAFKEKMVRDCLTRIGGFEESELHMQPIIGMEEPFRYRNKAQYPIGYVKVKTDDHTTGRANEARGEKKRLAAGFYAGRTHNIIEIDDCCLTPEINSLIVRTLLDHMKKYHIPAYDETTGKGLVRHLLIREGFHSGEVLICPIINGDSFPHAQEFVQELLKINDKKEEEKSSWSITSICFNVNKKKANTILGDKVIPCYGDPWIFDTLGGLTFRISPLSFYQVNPIQCEKLYAKAVEAAGLTGNEVVYDLYCGIGTISLFMAQKAKEVYGVEIVPEAIEDAKRNAKINGIENAHFYAGAAEDLVVSGKFDDRTPCPKADVVCIDPPRKGCAPELIETILKMQPERIVYVSCDPATLARDLKLLAGDSEKAAYRIQSVQPVDMFAHTSHVETVVLMSRVKD